MFGSAILDVAIGLAFIFSLLAIICSALSEWLAWIGAWRSRLLADALQNMLGSPEFAQQLLNTGVIAALRTETRAAPSYLYARQFSSALLGLMLPGDKGHELPTSAELHAAIDSGVPVTLRSTLRQLLADASRTVAITAASAPASAAASPPRPLLVEFTAAIERWFDDVMERYSGQYKRKAATSIAMIATVVCIAANVDTIAIVTALSRDPKLRDGLVQAAIAEVTARKSDTATKPATAPQSDAQDRVVEQSLGSLLVQRANGLPLGWMGNVPESWKICESPWLFQKLLGLTLSIIAVSLGAPFWFDMLNKLANLRAGGVKPPRADAESPAEKKTS